MVNGMDELDYLRQFRTAIRDPDPERIEVMRATLLRELTRASESARTKSSRFRPLRGTRGHTNPERMVGAFAHTRKRQVAVVACLVAAVGVSVAYLVIQTGAVKPVTSSIEPRPIEGVGSEVGRVPGPVNGGLLSIFDRQPLLGEGTLTSLSEASSLVSFPIYRPDVGQATPEVWVNTSRDESGAVMHDVALRYDSSLVVTYARWPAGSDIAGEYSAAVYEWKAGYTTTIAGHPAWVVPANAQAEGAPPVGVVHVSIGEVEVTLFGKMSIEDLVSLAQTLHA